MSAAKTLGNKMGLDTFFIKIIHYTFNFIIAGLCHIQILHFTALINFDEY